MPLTKYINDPKLCAEGIEDGLLTFDNLFEILLKRAVIRTGGELKPCGSTMCIINGLIFEESYKTAFLHFDKICKSSAVIAQPLCRKSYEEYKDIIG